MKDIPGGNAVLVSVDDLTALKEAFPNYYLDTEHFIRMLENAFIVARYTELTRARLGRDKAG